MSPTLLAALGAVAGGAMLAPFVRPTLLFALAIAGSVLSGNADRVGLPVGPDRLLTVAALASLLVGIATDAPPPGTRRLRLVDVLLVATAATALVSAVAVGSLFDEHGGFALLDRLGIVPFVGFVLADRLFGTERDRLVLVSVLVALGAYLGVTALAEAAGLDALVFPRYVLDPSVGTHLGRARGPFVEAVANGMAMFTCGVAAAVGATRFRTRWARSVSLAVVVLCAVGTLVTVTRAVWLGAVAGVLVAACADPRLRRLVPAIAGGAVVLVIGAFAVLPGLAQRADARASDEGPLWDRQNTNAAAVEMVLDDPLTGVGWDRYTDESSDFLRQADDIPLTGAGLEVHNVALAYASELGIPGALLWVTTVGAAVAAAWRGGRSLPPAWRAAGMAIVVEWGVVGLFGPLGYAFPNLATWVFLGVCAAPTARRVEGGTSRRRPAELSAARR